MLWHKNILWIWAQHKHLEYVPNINTEMSSRIPPNFFREESGGRSPFSYEWYELTDLLGVLFGIISSGYILWTKSWKYQMLKNV